MALLNDINQQSRLVIIYVFLVVLEYHRLKLMKKHKLSYFAVHRRLKAGWSREAAFGPKKTENWLSDELIEKAKQNGISYELLYWRKKQCWSDEEASTRKPSQSNKQIRKKEGLR